MKRISNIECIYTLNIYKLIIAIIIIDPLLNKLITVTTVLRSCEMLCFLAILFYEFKLFRLNGFNYINKKIKLLFFLLFVISFFIVVRGQWPSSIKDIGLYILSPILSYMLPFLILPLPNFKYRNQILHLFYYSALFVIPIWFLNINNLVQTGLNSYQSESIGRLLPFFSTFLLGLYSFFSKKQNLISILIWGGFLLLMLLNARRNVSFTLVLYALIAYSFFISNRLKKYPIKYTLVILVSFLMFLIFLMNFNRLAEGTFNNMMSRVSEDTRSGVEEQFFLDFMNAPIEDWIWGRGVDGSYSQTTVNYETGEIKYQRPVIETGYLHMLMKGGIIYILIILMFLIEAVKKAFTKEDKAIKYIGFILLTYLIDMYSTNPLSTYSVRSIIFWICVSFCLQYYKISKKNIPNTNVSNEIRLVCKKNDLSSF